MNGDSGIREGVPMRTNTAKGTRAIAACGACALAVAMTGCGASFEGSGSKDAASAEQLAMHADDPWAVEIGANSKAQSDFTLVDGVYTGTGLGMDGLITVTLAVQGNHINCIEVTQEGETQSVGGFEAIRDGKYAAMIDVEQGPDIDCISGATITTAGVRQATTDALIQAGADLQPVEVGSGTTIDKVQKGE